VEELRSNVSLRKPLDVNSVSKTTVYKSFMNQPFQLLADLTLEAMAPSRTEREGSVVTERYQCHALLTSANCKLIVFLCGSSHRPAYADLGGTVQRSETGNTWTRRG
jgi:hypothetical protein